MDISKIPIALLQLYKGMSHITPNEYVEIVDMKDQLMFRYKLQHGFVFITHVVNGAFQYVMTPGYDISNQSRSGVTSTPDSVIYEYKRWLNRIAAYYAIPTQLSAWDFEETYYQELYSNIILDDDAEEAPFDVAKQLYLDEYCHVTIEALLRERTQKGADIGEIDKIIQEVECVKNDLPRLTKAETFRRFCRIWAKTKKYSVTLFIELTKTIFFDFAKDKTIELVGAVKEALPMMIETAKQLIE